MKTILKTISTLALSVTVFVGILIAVVLLSIMIVLGAAVLFVCWLCLGIISAIIGITIVLLLLILIVVFCIPASIVTAACLTGLLSVPESFKEISEDVKEFFKDDDDDEDDLGETINMKVKETLKGFPDTWGN